MKEEIDLNYGSCADCGTPLDPFNRMHIDFVFYCRDCFYEIQKTAQLVKIFFDNVPRFV